jgi:intein-encoded DNA endonuclease-like protein
MPIFKKKNDDFFKKWSSEMAYVLGFFTADGNMIRNKRGAHFISIEITDRDLLIKIRTAIGSNHKIGIRKSINKRWKENYRLQIGSKAMFNDLIKLGLTPNKSKTIKLLKIPIKYFSDFVRGYFDGDGNVCISNYKRADRNFKKSRTLISGFTSGSKEFLSELFIKLKKLAKVNGGTLHEHSGYRLYFSVKDSLIMYKFMYNNLRNNLFLLRKKKIFENYFNIK